MQRLTKYPLLLENIAKYTEEEKERGKGAAGGRVLSADPQPRQPGGAGNGKPHEAEGLSEAPGSLQPQAEHGPAAQRVQEHGYHQAEPGARGGPGPGASVRTRLWTCTCCSWTTSWCCCSGRRSGWFFAVTAGPPAPRPRTRQVLSPIIKLSSAMTRDVATDRKAFYVIFSWENGAQIYELVAQTVSERKNWCDLINETAGSLKLPGSNRQKPRRAAPSLSAPHSPSYDRERLLSSSENGNSPRETLHSDEREKEGALEGMEFEERGPEKQEKDSERILAELLALHKPRAAGEGGLAAAALERVSELKRLLVGGSPLLEDGDPGSPEDGWHQAPENRGARDEDKERDAGDGAESEGGAPGGAPNGPGSLIGGRGARVGRGPSSPLVLTPRQSEDVRRSCQHLEEVVRRLRTWKTPIPSCSSSWTNAAAPPSPHFT
ncbi:unnamed protein product [Lepidochelys kempii]